MWEQPIKAFCHPNGRCTLEQSACGGGCVDVDTFACFEATFLTEGEKGQLCFETYGHCVVARAALDKAHELLEPQDCEIYRNTF